MKHILLCCGGGFSSSLLATKMQEYAKQLIEDHVEVLAVGVGEAERRLEHLRKADILLVAPQVRYTIPDFQRVIAREKIQIPIEMIPPIHYGTCNGEAVVKYALDVMEGK